MVVNAIGTAVPHHDVHHAYALWAAAQIEDQRERSLFDRMCARSGIGHRWSVLPVSANGHADAVPDFYAAAQPGTGARMAIYAHAAPALALDAVAALDAKASLGGITHIVLASCTGFVAPGVDQIIMRALGLPPTVERLLVGYMGCYAGIVALRCARHIVRSDPTARVLVVCVELCTLHLQQTGDLARLLAMMQFADGAAAALVTAAGAGIALDTPFAMTVPDTGDLICWDIGDHGFAMHLDGAVPAHIHALLRDRRDWLPRAPEDVAHWAVHGGGRSILDAVEQGLGLGTDTLADSRAVLNACGNMSSATVLFVLERIRARGGDGAGIALAFGPGLAAEGLSFHIADGSDA